MTHHKNHPLTASHWGVYRAETKAGQLHDLHPFEQDPDPSPIGRGYLGVLDDALRIRAPMVRKSWLENGPGFAADKRGKEGFVQISWDEAETLVANELNRVRKNFGNEAIYGGSYGWSGAGRFHHAQSQLHRFLNCAGGYTKSVNTYSHAAAEVILNHILGRSGDHFHHPPNWASIAENTELFVAFGGIPRRNSQVSSGGMGEHTSSSGLRAAKTRGAEFVNISPIRADVEADLGADWIAIRPGSDVALMLGLAHELIRNDWCDTAFVERYTTGFPEFHAYVMGEADGMEKTAQWAAEITQIDAVVIVDLARRMAGSRTLISIGWSLSRQEHGEQPVWMATVLAAMLGQIGLPGGGIGYGYCAANSVGVEKKIVRYASVPQKSNAVKAFIPVARISDMLLNPGESCRYNGQTLTYPDIKLIYWAGGNPFHHHQDLTRLQRAWQKPQTIIVNEWCWNTLAKHADIVLPCTTQLERKDLMITPRDPYIIAMEQIVDPVGEARDDFDIFCGISKKLGIENEFTEGRSAQEWLRWIYEESREMARAAGVDLPSHDALHTKGWHKVEPDPKARSRDGSFALFRDDPLGNPLNTPSGRIEISSDTIAGFNDAGVMAHPAWYTPTEWLGAADQAHPFHLISAQPTDKLHSQMDHGPVSMANKINGHGRMSIHPADARLKGIAEGDLVRGFNKRGACLAAACYDDALMRNVLMISTGAWMDPVLQEDGTLLCRSGNPNTVTRDQGTSVLAQGPTAHSCLVNVEKHINQQVENAAYAPPEITGKFNA